MMPTMLSHEHALTEAQSVLEARLLAAVWQPEAVRQAQRAFDLHNAEVFRRALVRDFARQTLLLAGDRDLAVLAGRLDAYALMVWRAWALAQVD